MGLKKETTVVLMDCYRIFVSDPNNKVINPKTNKKRNIPYKEYRKIVVDFFEFLIDNLIEGHLVHFPLALGNIQICGIKQKILKDENGNIKNLPPDWKETIKLWNEDPEAKKKKIIVRYFNIHTDGITYRATWFRAKVSGRWKDLYAFRFSKKQRKRISEEINKNHTRYPVKFQKYE
jgi:hypothetical protein